MEITATRELPVTDLAWTIGVGWLPHLRSLGRDGEYNSLEPGCGALLVSYVILPYLMDAAIV